MNYLKSYRTKLNLTQVELVNIFNDKMKKLKLSYKITQTRLSNLEQLSENQLIQRLKVIEYKNLQEIFKLLDNL